MQQITHTECVYRPGDAEAVAQVFSAMGFAVTQGDPYTIAFVNPEVKDAISNCIYASEITPAQLAFEGALHKALGDSSGLRKAADEWEGDFRANPQRSFHFGFRYDDKEAFEATIERLRAVGASGGPLEGRVLVTGVYFPGDPGSITDVMAQAFAWTDVFASGVLAFGQHLELQWHIKDMVYS